MDEWRYTANAGVWVFHEANDTPWIMFIQLSPCNVGDIDTVKIDSKTCIVWTKINLHTYILSRVWTLSVKYFKHTFDNLTPVVQ